MTQSSPPAAEAPPPAVSKATHLYAVLGAVVGASALGLFESMFLLATQGVPDLLSPFYAVVLYGLIGVPFGIAAAVASAMLPKIRNPGAWARPLAMMLGVVFAVAPMLLFILMYLGNKVVFAEQGVPMTGKLVILGLVALFAVLKLSGGAWFSKRFGVGALHLAGAEGAMLALTGLLALLPVGGRGDFAHGKPIPGGMVDNPNVLIITVDTLRADALGAYGKGGDASPSIDALAADSIVFENANAHASWTRSSFASLWSSRIASSHKADQKASRLSDDLVLLSEALQDAGVTTGNLANNINVSATFNFDQGYDTFVYEAPDYHFGASESVFSLTFYKVVHKLREKLGGSKLVESFYQPAEVVLGDAQSFIEANAEGRWMLGVHLMEPHDPYFEHPYLDGTSAEIFNGVGFARAEVEKPSLDQRAYLEGVYAGEVRHMDAKLADFMEWLKARGMYDDLMIVLTADHGEEFGEHGGFWHGTTLYQEQIHVPLVVKLPGNAMAGERVAWQARLIDVAPTIVGAMGVKAPEDWRGTDLLGTLRQEVTERKAEEAAEANARALVDQLSEQRDAGFLPIDQLQELDAAEALLIAKAEQKAEPCDRYALPNDRVAIAEEDFEGNVLASVAMGGFKLITANPGNPRGLQELALYDLRGDSAETTNLAQLASPICGEPASDRISLLKRILETEVSGAASTAVVPEDVEVDQAETCRLCAIGYMNGPECDDC